jgi:hypothetical protein
MYARKWRNVAANLKIDMLIRSTIQRQSFPVHNKKTHRGVEVSLYAFYP